MTPTPDQNQAPDSTSPKNNRSVLSLAGLVLLLIAVLAAARWYQHTLAPAEGVIRHDCDLQAGSCEVEQGQGRFTVQSGPLPMRSLSTLNLNVQLEGMTGRRILADLQGAEMYMGVNRFELTPATDGQWQGQTELAVCTTGSMIWQLTLEIQTETGTQQHLFEFEAR